MAISDKDDKEILTALTLAMIKHSRASLQDLAKAIGVSRATLYRFCNTREELETRLIACGVDFITKAMDEALLEKAPPLTALRSLNEKVLQHSEFVAFLIYHCEPDNENDEAQWTGWTNTLDAFFLRGQQMGVFRIDVTEAALTDIWFSSLIGLADAERRGRVAKAGLASVLERVFLQGATAHETILHGASRNSSRNI